jgi:hypothetical protein
MSANRQILAASFSRWLSRAAFAGLVVTALTGTAFGYRPFDGTDAGVAKLGEVEIELAPAGVEREHSLSTVIAPFTILNFGIAPGWEAVFSGQGQFPQFQSDDPFSIAGVSAFLKHVVSPGVLQDQSGPSVAVEFGPLLPGFRADAGYGANLAGIVSQRWDWGTVHWNLQGQYTRDHHADAFMGAIIEGPERWKVRPVAEFFYEDEIGVSRTISGLVGAIWQVSEELAFDVAFRHAIVNDMGSNWHPVEEVRAGLTFAFPMSIFSASRRP